MWALHRFVTDRSALIGCPTPNCKGRVNRPQLREGGSMRADQKDAVQNRWSQRDGLLEGGGGEETNPLLEGEVGRPSCHQMEGTETQ